jgi:hypothetical protein
VKTNQPALKKSGGLLCTPSVFMVQLQHMPQQVQNKPAKFHKPQHANAECSEGMWVLVGSFFMFSDFYQLDLQNKTCVALADLQ